MTVEGWRVVKIDAYLLALRAALRDRLPPELTSSRLREVRGHLQMSAAEAGEAEALRRYGPPRLVANEMVRAYRGYPNASGSRLAFGAGLCLFLALFLPQAYMQATLAKPLEFGRAATFVSWAPPLGLAVFLCRVAQTRRWLVLPGALWATAACAATLAFCVGFNPAFEARELPTVRESVRREIAQWTARTEDVAAWRRGEFPLRAPYVERVQGTAHYAFVSVSDAEDVLTERVFENREAAEKAWRANGEAWAREVSERLDNSLGNLAALPRMFPDKPVPWGRLAGMVASGTAWSVVFMALSNALTLGVCVLADRQRMRRA